MIRHQHQAATLRKALDAARAAIEASPLRLQAGATQPHPQVIVLRVVAPVVEPAMQLLRPVWSAWRQALWGLPGNVPRLWNLQAFCNNRSTESLARQPLTTLAQR